MRFPFFARFSIRLRRAETSAYSALTKKRAPEEEKEGQQEFQNRFPRETRRAGTPLL